MHHLCKLSYLPHKLDRSTIPRATILAILRNICSTRDRPWLSDIPPAGHAWLFDKVNFLVKPLPRMKFAFYSDFDIVIGICIRTCLRGDLNIRGGQHKARWIAGVSRDPVAIQTGTLSVEWSFFGCFLYGRGRRGSDGC